MGFGDKVSRGFSSFGKKVGKGASDFGNKASGVMDAVDKFLPDAKTIANTTADISGAIATGAGTAAGIAAATGIGNAGLSEALAGISGLAYGVNKGATAIGKGLDKAEMISGVARSGIERVR